MSLYFPPLSTKIMLFVAFEVVLNFEDDVYPRRSFFFFSGQIKAAGLFMRVNQSTLRGRKKLKVTKIWKWNFQVKANVVFSHVTFVYMEILLLLSDLRKVNNSFQKQSTISETLVLEHTSEKLQSNLKITMWVVLRRLMKKLWKWSLEKL